MNDQASDDTLVYKDPHSHKSVFEPHPCYQWMVVYGDFLQPGSYPAPRLKIGAIYPILQIEPFLLDIIWVLNDTGLNAVTRQCGLPVRVTVLFFLVSG